MNDLVEPDLAKRSLEDRIEAVLEDVKSGADVYRAIPPHQLAELLGINDADEPGGEDGWSFIKYIPREPLADYLERVQCGSEIFDCLKGKVGERRLATIKKLGDEFDKTGKFDLSLLLKKEVYMIEEAIQAHELDQLGGGTVIAQRYIKGSHGRWLRFEAFIEDDGRCVDLKTPYDKRDGNFTDLTDCMTEEY
jgi:hypothetical protein